MCCHKEILRHADCWHLVSILCCCKRFSESGKFIKSRNLSLIVLVTAKSKTEVAPEVREPCDGMTEDGRVRGCAGLHRREKCKKGKGVWLMLSLGTQSCHPQHIHGTDIDMLMRTTP